MIHSVFAYTKKFWFVPFGLFVIIGSIYAYNFFNGNSTTITTSSQIFQSLPPTTPSYKNKKPLLFTLSQPPYLLFFTGNIDENYSRISIPPFFFFTSIPSRFDNRVNEKISPEAEFKILLKKNDAVFLEREFDAQVGCPIINFNPAIDVVNACSRDHSYGHFSFVHDGLSAQPDEVIIQHLGKDIYNRKEPTQPFPILTVVSQEYENGIIKILWEVQGESTNLYYDGYVSNNNFQAEEGISGEFNTQFFRGIGNVDGSKIFNGNSFTFAPQYWIEGDIRVAIFVTDGLRTYMVKSDVFSVPKLQVGVKINLPEEGKTYYKPRRKFSQTWVPLEAELLDPLTGISCFGCPAMQSGNTFTWTSNIDGVIFRNQYQYRGTSSDLSVGDHVITLQLQHWSGATATASVHIKIAPESFVQELFDRF